MRKLSLIPALFLLAACEGVGGSQPIDVNKFFASLEGPKIATVQDTLLESAKNAEKMGDFKGAAQLYQQVLEKHPDDKDILLSLADAYRRSGDHARAIAVYDNLLLKDSGNAAAKEGKGLALMAKGDFDTPVALLDQAAKADPTRWKTLNALGILFTTRNMHKEAQQYFDAALKQSPGNPSILNNMGLSQAMNRQFDEAANSLMQASALTASNSVDRKRIDLNLALVYAISGKLDEANDIAEQYFTGPVLDNNKGLYAHLAKDDQMAKAYLNMALTESKVFYQKAWNNLQQISTTSAPPPKHSDVTIYTPSAEPPPAPAAAPAPAPAEKAPVKKKTAAKKKTKSKPKPKAVPKTDDDIAAMATAPAQDPVPDSPIP